MISPIDFVRVKFYFLKFQVGKKKHDHFFIKGDRLIKNIHAWMIIDKHIIRKE